MNVQELIETAKMLVPNYKGLDGLRDRLKDYVQIAARFAKWRAVITIGDRIHPTELTGRTTDGLSSQ